MIVRLHLTFVKLQLDFFIFSYRYHSYKEGMMEDCYHELCKENVTSSPANRGENWNTQG